MKESRNVNAKTAVLFLIVLSPVIFSCFLQSLSTFYDVSFLLLFKPTMLQIQNSFIETAMQIFRSQTEHAVALQVDIYWRFFLLPQFGCGTKKFFERKFLATVYLQFLYKKQEQFFYKCVQKNFCASIISGRERIYNAGLFISVDRCFQSVQSQKCSDSIQLTQLLNGYLITYKIGTGRTANKRRLTLLGEKVALR